MAPAWDQLGEAYAGSSSVLIADVDCTQEGDLCQKVGASGYPTLKYYLAGEQKDYQGGRDFATLNTFTQTNLLKACQVSDPKDCTEKEIAFIKAMKEKSDGVPAQLERLKKMQSAKAKPELRQWINQRINILTQLSQEKSDL